MKGNVISDWEYLGDVEEPLAQASFNLGLMNLSDTNFGRQVSDAVVAVRDAKDLIFRYYSDYSSDEKIDLSLVFPVANNIVEQVCISPSSILWLTRIGLKEEYYVEHPVSVCVLSVCVARLLNLSRGDMESLSMCALLFDIGNVAIDRNLIFDPENFDSSDIEKIRAHTIFGRNLLESSMEIYGRAYETALQHHERLDGSGYPCGLKGSEISLFSRIVAVCDVYHAITSNRLYKDSQLPSDALLFLKRQAGVKFDKRVVDALDSIISVYRC